jgi:DNA-binding transcriptional regulator YbjK
MTGPERREQLIAVGRKLFADKGFEATTVEEVAAKANVSKPSSTSTSAARRASTPSSSTARSRP